MSTVEEIWEKLEAIRDLIAENPRDGRKATDAAIGLFADLAVPPPPDLLAFGYQIDGTAWRANGRLDAAERCYNRAETVYRNALAECDDFALRRELVLGRADLRRRWSFLFLERCEWDRGLEMLEFAEERFTAAGQRHQVGRVYLARGQLFWERAEPGDQDLALEDLSRSVEMIDPEKSAGAFKAAAHNLTCALTLHPEPAQVSLERAFKALQRGRLSKASRRSGNGRRGRQLFGHAELTVPDAKRRYLQGKILLRLGRPKDALPFFKSTRTDLMLLGNYPRDIYAVTLELIDCCLSVYLHPWRKVAALLTETFTLCPVHDLTPEVLAALELLEAALEARSLPAAREHLDTALRHCVTAD